MHSKTLLSFALLNSTWVLPMFQIGSESHQANFRNFWHPNWMPDQKTQTQHRNLSSEFVSFAQPQGSWLYLKVLVNSSFTPHWHHSITGAPQATQGCTQIWIPSKDYLCHVTMHNPCKKASFHVMKEHFTPHHSLLYSQPQNGSQKFSWLCLRPISPNEIIPHCLHHNHLNHGQ